MLLIVIPRNVNGQLVHYMRLYYIMSDLSFFPALFPQTAKNMHILPVLTSVGLAWQNIVYINAKWTVELLSWKTALQQPNFGYIN